MSKGLGSTQRRVLTALDEGSVNEGLPESKKALVGGDRSTLRRAFRTLVQRTSRRERKSFNSSARQLVPRTIGYSNPINLRCSRR